MKYRRARTIVMYWHEDELTSENYLSNSDGDTNAVALDPIAASLLDQFTDWVDPHDLIGTLPGLTEGTIDEAIDSLAACELLYRSDEEDRVAREEKFLRLWEWWGEEARFFHFATKNAPYRVGVNPDEAMKLREARVGEVAGPPPPIFKSYPGAPRLYLDRRFIPLSDDFGTVLADRRTHRNFTDASVGFREFSTILYYTFAPMLFCDANVYGTLLMKTSPSGGARHELEGYVAALNVEGVPRGIYHYNSEVHALELISDTCDPEFLSYLMYGMNLAAESAFTCVVTAIFGRTMYKYPNSRNYRATLLGAGHLGQTFALCATALKLGPWQTIVFRDDEFERALQLDPYEESVIYTFGAGHPVLAATGLPSDLKIANYAPVGAGTEQKPGISPGG